MIHVTLFHMSNILYFYISAVRGLDAAPNVAVFCSSLTSCFCCTLLRYFVNYFVMIPVAPIITGITFVFTLHMRCIYIVRSLYFRIFSASFFNTFLFPETATMLAHTFPFVITDYDVRFTVRDISAGLRLLIP
jgi:hypothetical protein